MANQKPYFLNGDSERFFIGTSNMVLVRGYPATTPTAQQVRIFLYTERLRVLAPPFSLQTDKEIAANEITVGDQINDGHGYFVVRTVTNNNTSIKSLCYNHMKFNAESQRLSQKRSILILSFSSGGLGDLVFGAKLAKYILASFLDVDVTLIVRTFKEKEFLEEGGGFEQYESRYHIEGLIRDGDVIEDYHGSSLYNFKCDKEYHLLYLAPKTATGEGLRLTGNKSNKTYSNLSKNSYVLEEYNYNAPGVEGMRTGIPSPEDSPELGIFLNDHELMGRLPPELSLVLNKRPFSIAYFNLGNHQIWNTLPVGGRNCSNLRYLLGADQHITYRKNCYQLNLSLCFNDYVTDLCKIARTLSRDREPKTAKLVVLCRHGILDSLSEFLDDCELS